MTNPKKSIVRVTVWKYEDTNPLYIYSFDTMEEALLASSHIEKSDRSIYCTVHTSKIYTLDDIKEMW